MIKVLHLFTTLDSGGVESFLFNYYFHINTDNINFDVIVPGKRIGYLEEQFRERGSCIYHVPTFHENPLRMIQDVSKIIKKGNYDVVHCHGYKSCLGLLLAKIHKCPVRIIHSHMAFVNETPFQKVARKAMMMIVRGCATDKLACGKDAAEWLFGREEKEAVVINNAIDLEKYRFSEQDRIDYRKELGIRNSEYVLGNVARLTYQKNQSFLLQIVKRLKDEGIYIKLLLIGNGEDENELKEECETLGIKDQVMFLGLRKDVPKLLSAIDCFVLPSRFEGLPVVLVEVQAAGVPIIVSDNVTHEIDVSGSLQYVSLEDGVDRWCQIIKMQMEGGAMLDKRFDVAKKLEQGKFDIDYQAKKLEELYISLVKLRSCQGSN